MVSIAHHFYQKIIFFLLAACTLLILAVPAQAERLPDLINKVKPADVFPNATRFGAPEGKPMMAKVYEGDKEVGVVYITTDVVSTRGYSSKPIDTIVALDNEGTIKGAKMLEHHEPILLIGIPRSKVDTFIDGYIGMNPTKNPPQAQRRTRKTKRFPFLRARTVPRRNWFPQKAENPGLAPTAE